MVQIERNENMAIVKYAHENFKLVCDWNIGIGGDIWTSGILVVDYVLGAFNKQEFKQSTVLELGSGTGFVGLAISSFLDPKLVVLTDLPSHVESIAGNVALNGLENIEVCALDWNDKNCLLDPFDVIIGTDIAYQVEYYDPIVETFKKYSKKSTKIILGFSRVDTEMAFFNKLEAAGFMYTKVPDRKLAEKYRGKDYAVFLIQWRDLENSYK